MQGFVSLSANSARSETSRYQKRCRTFPDLMSGFGLCLARVRGPHAEALNERNRHRNRHVREWLGDAKCRDAFREWPTELFLSLMIGPGESYCRVWLSGRVKIPPGDYREELT
jgi:hypothetical protein